MMIREVLTSQGGLGKEGLRNSCDGAVRSSPRHYGLMAGRQSHMLRSPYFNWIYVVWAVFLVFLMATLVLNTSTIEPAARPLNSATAGVTTTAGPASVHLIAYLALQVAELQDTVQLQASTASARRSTTAPTSLPTALAELNLERASRHNALTQISTALNGIAKLLQELKTPNQKKITTPSASNPSEVIVSKAPVAQSTNTPTHRLAELSLSDPFNREEIREYIKVRRNRGGVKNFMGVNATVGVIGHGCVSSRALLEKYMDYEVGEVCRDDWVVAQQLMLRGCEPLPRRRCRARGPTRFTKPLLANESLWAIPADENVRWENYFCRNFSCLVDWRHRKKFFKCSPCFDLTNLEQQRWVVENSTAAEFLITDVLDIKPGEIRIGLDYSTGTGTFAARMKERGVTVVSATLNLGAPFSEVIALRGLVPLYISINQRLPFFDNTLDIVHTALLLDAWIDPQLLDFILFDFDRVLRPGGLLWVDRFFCHRDDLAHYLFYFKRLRYKVHLWITTPKIDQGRNEVYFSAVWEKPGHTVTTPF